MNQGWNNFQHDYPMDDHQPQFIMEQEPMEHMNANMPKQNQMNMMENMGQMNEMSDFMKKNKAVQSKVQQFKIEDQPIQRSYYDKSSDSGSKTDVPKAPIQKDEKSSFFGFLTKKDNQPSTKNQKNKNIKKQNPDILKTYNKKDPQWWKKVFPCCFDPQPLTQFEDCDMCQKRVYRYNEEEEYDQPYISPLRIKIREKQPVVTFCDQLDNNPLLKQTWN